MRTSITMNINYIYTVSHCVLHVPLPWEGRVANHPLKEDDKDNAKMT